MKVISLPYILQVLYVLCFTEPRYQVSVYRTIGPLVLSSFSQFFSVYSDQHLLIGTAVKIITLGWT